jgi:hypothetical protein
VRTYGSILIDEFFKDAPADQICSQLQLCSFSQNKQGHLSFRMKNSVTCEACEFVAEVAEVFIKADNLNSTELLNDVEAICKYLPTDLQFECQAFVLVGAPIIIKALEAGADPQLICSTFDFCPKPTTSKEALAFTTVKGFRHISQ